MGPGRLSVLSDTEGTWRNREKLLKGYFGAKRLVQNKSLEGRTRRP